MEKRGLQLVFLTALISGVSVFINKFGVSGIDSSVFTFAKNVVVAVLLFSLIFLFKDFSQLKALTKKQWGKLMLIGLVGGSAPFLLFFRGLQLTNAAAASLIQKAMFVFVAVLAVYFLKEKLNKRFFIAAALLLIGNALLIGFVWKGFGIGDLMILGATMLWAVENIISKHALKEIPSRIVAFGRMFFGSAFILIYLAASGKAILIAALSFSQLAWIGVTSALLLFYVLTWYSGLKHVPATLATMVLLLGSVVTTILSLLSGNIITVSEVFGIVFILAGVFIAASQKYLWSSSHGWN